MLQRSGRGNMTNGGGPEAAEANCQQNTLAADEIGIFDLRVLRKECLSLHLPHVGCDLVSLASLPMSRMETLTHSDHKRVITVFSQDPQVPWIDQLLWPSHSQGNFVAPALARLGSVPGAFVGLPADVFFAEPEWAEIEQTIGSNEGHYQVVAIVFASETGLVAGQVRVMKPDIVALLDFCPCQPKVDDVVGDKDLLLKGVWSVVPLFSFLMAMGGGASSLLSLGLAGSPSRYSTTLRHRRDKLRSANHYPVVI